MIGNAKRRFYRLSLVGVCCFLCSTLLFDLVEVARSSLLVNSLSGILEFIGCFFLFLAFEAVSYPDDYDKPEELHPGHLYANLFFLVASSMLLATGFLLIWIFIRRGPTVAEQLVLLWGPVVSAGCILIGLKSRKEAD